MAGNIRFHSKYHAQQHHTLKTSSTEGYPDAATDPVASAHAPFQGPFYINGVINTNNTIGTVNGVNYSGLRNEFHDAVLINSSLSATGDVTIDGNLHVHKNIHVTENVYLSGGSAGFINLGDADTDQIRINAHIITDVLPGTSEMYNIGSVDKRWNTVYCKNIDLAGDLLIGSCPTPALKVSPTTGSVLIGTCNEPDSDAKLFVANGKTVLDGNLVANSESAFNDTIALNADELVAPGKKHIFGAAENENEIYSDSEELKITSKDTVRAVANKLRVSAPVIDTSDQPTSVNISTLAIGDELIYADQGTGSVGIGTDSPDTDICLHGDVHITGATGEMLSVESPVLSVTSPAVSVVSDTIDMTSRDRTVLTGDTIKLNATSNDPQSGDIGALQLQSKITSITCTEELDINTGVVNLANQPTRYKLNSSQTALQFDENALVINSIHNRVGINKLIPQATLHVGGDAIIDGKLTVNDSDVDISGGDDVTLQAEDKILLKAPVLDLDTPVIDLTTQDTSFDLKSSEDALDMGSCLLKLDTQNRRVGVNVCAPTDTLSVSGTVLLQGSATNIESDTLTASGDRHVFTPATSLDISTAATSLSSDTLSMTVPAVNVQTPTNVNLTDVIGALTVESDLMSFDGANKRVGIGTATPSEKFHVVGDTLIQGTSKVDIVGTTISLSGDKVVADTPIVEFVKPSTHIKIPAVANALYIDSDGSNPALSIDGSQTRVGIGTDSPDGELGIEATDPTITLKDRNLSDGPVKLKSGGVNNDFVIQIDFGDNDPDNTFRTWRNNTTKKTDLSLCADNGGRVGIGTNTPVDDLDISGNVTQIDPSPEYHFGTTSASHYNWRLAAQEEVDGGFEIASGTMSPGTNAPGDVYTNRLVITADGKVGIGKNDPAVALDVAGEISSTSTTSDDVTITATTSNRVLYTDSNKKLATSDKFFFDGNTIGINTTTPQSAGDVSIPTGLDIRKSKLLISNDGASAYIANEVLNPGVGGTTSTATVFAGCPGQHLVFDLGNNQDSDIIAFRHSSNNNTNIDATNGFVYKPNGATAQVGINASQDQLGEYSLTVNGPTNIEGTLRVGGDLLIEGDYAQLELKNLEIEDKAYVINKGGSLQDTPGSGMLIEGSGAIAGFVKVKDDDSTLFQIKAPTGETLTLDIDNPAKLTMESDLAVLGPSKINQDVTSAASPTFKSITLTDGLVDGVDITDLASQVTDLENELDSTQAGAGLNGDGTYVASSTSEYITAATSLKDADFKLDGAIKNVAEDVTGLQSTVSANETVNTNLRDKLATSVGVDTSTLEYEPPSNSTYLAAATSCKSADSLLDAAIKANSDNITSGSNLAQAINTAAGLDGSGQYAANTSADYIHDAASLKQADDKLDSQVNYLQRMIGEGLPQGPNTNKTPLTGNHKGRLDALDTSVSSHESSINSITSDVASINDTLSNTIDDSLTAGLLVATDSTGKITATGVADWLSGGSGISVVDDGDGTASLLLSHVDTASLKSSNLTPGYLTYTDNSKTLQSTGLEAFVIGTENQVIVANGGAGLAEKVKLSLPQDIDTNAEPTLKNVALTGLGNNSDQLVKISSTNNKLYSAKVSDFLDATNSTKIEFVDDASSGKTALKHTGVAPTVSTGSGNDVIRNITVDDTGHVTAYETGAASSPNVFSATTAGLVPGPTTDQTGANAGYFLKGSGEWEQIPGVSSKLVAGKNINILPSSTTDSATIETKEVIEATQFITTSDVALKDNISNISNSLNLVNQLQGVSFTWKNRTVKHTGFLANDVEKIIPDAVSVTGSGHKAIDYNSIISHLVEAVKSLTKQVKDLQSKD